MNFLDIGIIVLFLGLGVYGIFQGIVRQGFSWAGLVLGHISGVRFYAEVQGLLRFDFPNGDVAAYLLTFLTVYVVFRLLGLLVERWVRGSTLSGTDRFGGMVAGLAKGVVLSVLLVFVLVILLPRDSSILRESKIAPKAMVAAGWATHIFPKRIGDSFRKKLEGVGWDAGTKGESPAAGRQPKNRSRK